MKIKWRIDYLILKKSIHIKRAFLSLRVRYLVMIVLLAMLSGVLYYEFVYDDPTWYIPDLNIAIRTLEQRLHEEVLHEKGKGCEMPKLDPFDKEAMQFWSKPSKIICEGIDWVECYVSTLNDYLKFGCALSECWVVQEILDKFSDIECSYEDIVYVHDYSYYFSEPVHVFGIGKYYLNQSDYVRVTCSGKDGFSLISSKWVGYKAGFRPLPRKSSPSGRENSLNVLILCFDSTAHNHFRRSMPKSYKVLTDELKAVALNSYNIVGDATVAAMFPVLTGKSELEPPDTRKTMSSKHIDPDWLIFHLMNLDGYRTAYFEDMPWVGTFQYRHNGFSRQPADHYSRAFFQEECKRSMKFWLLYKTSYCVGAIPQFKLMLNLTEQFFQLEGKKFCFTFISDIAHDINNMLGAADDDVVDFLRKFKDRGRLEDTLLIVMGDHGSRQNEIRTVYQGRIEERLPLMTIVLPQEFKKIRPQAESALRNNVDVLTTPFDIHATVLDFVGLKQYINNYKIPGSDIKRALSLLEPIPNTRTCSEAGVMVHWCACSNWVPVAKWSRMYELVPHVLADFINNVTRAHRQVCANRTLIQVKWVMKQTNNEAILKARMGKELDKYLPRYASKPLSPNLMPTSEYFQANIIMGPGKAHYEGSLRYRVKHDDFIISERDISRTNVYGREAACVSATYPHLNKYCYCKDRSSTPAFGL